MSVVCRYGCGAVRVFIGAASTSRATIGAAVAAAIDVEGGALLPGVRVGGQPSLPGVRPQDRRNGARKAARTFKAPIWTLRLDSPTSAVL